LPVLLNSNWYVQPQLLANSASVTSTTTTTSETNISHAKTTTTPKSANSSNQNKAKSTSPNASMNNSSRSRSNSSNNSFNTTPVEQTRTIESTTTKAKSSIRSTRRSTAVAHHNDSTSDDELHNDNHSCVQNNKRSRQLKSALNQPQQSVLTTTANGQSKLNDYSIVSLIDQQTTITPQLDQHLSIRNQFNAIAAEPSDNSSPSSPPSTSDFEYVPNDAILSKNSNSKKRSLSRSNSPLHPSPLLVPSSSGFSTETCLSFDMTQLGKLNKNQLCSIISQLQEQTKTLLLQFEEDDTVTTTVV
jgi:hypothetical protein